MLCKILSVSNNDRYEEMKSINDCGYMDIVETKNGNNIIRFVYIESYMMVMYSSTIKSHIKTNGVHEIETQNNTYVFEEIK